MLRKYAKTNLFIIDEDLWKWAKYRADVLGFNSVSEYIFKLMKADQEENIIERIKEGSSA